MLRTAAAFLLLTSFFIAHSAGGQAKDEKPSDEKPKLKPETQRYIDAVHKFLDEGEALNRLCLRELTLPDYDRNLAKVTDARARIPDPTNEATKKVELVVDSLSKSIALHRKRLAAFIELQQLKIDTSRQVGEFRQQVRVIIEDIIKMRKALPAPTPATKHG